MSALPKIVFLAGTKSHGPGDHEYEKGLRLFARAVGKAARTDIHLYGWPDDPATLDDADCIVVYADGSDHNEADHPLLVGNRLAVLQKQMARGCGFVTLHYATFAPVKRGGPQYLDWVGGYFDYETGSGANHWASAIQHWESKVALPHPDHPSCRGVAPFAVTEEWYYQMRLSPRVMPLLQVIPPGGSQPQVVAWALERADGGRGFACTGGHHHANWALPDYQRFIAQGILWAAKAAGSPQPTTLDDPIRTLILTGKHHPAHRWQETTPALTELLQRDPRFVVTIWEDPERLATESLAFDLLIQNYCNWESPSLSVAGRRNLLRFVREGGGLLLVHFANGAWRDWPEYFGGLSRRVWVDGKASHDAYGPFRVKVTAPAHRLVAGLADFDTVDELYCSQVGELPVEPLLMAHSKVTNRDEPLAFAYRESAGRIFQTLLGHDAQAIRKPTHAEVIRRAAAWCAGREVLPLPVPAEAPLAPAPSTEKGVLDARRGGRQVVGQASWQEAPLRVTCRVRLFSATNYNILIASDAKSNPWHWEVYTEAGTGRLSCYLPGANPQNLISAVNLCDGQWHTVTWDYLPNRVSLAVDGKAVASQQIGRTHTNAPIGPLWLGAYPPDGLGCDGFLDDITIERDGKTLAHWAFEGDEGLKPIDSASAAMAAAENWQVPLNGTWPRINRKTTTDWSAVGNDPGRMRHANLGQINKSNVKQLRKAWEFRTADASNGTTIECTPVIVNGVMYITTVKLRVVALNAATGKALWAYDPKSSGVNRGVAYWTDGKAERIVFGVPDGRLISLDARTGKPDPRFGKKGTVYLRENYERDLSKLNYGVTSAPAVFENLIVVPIVNTESQPGAPGDIRAFDIRTGREVWRFHTVPEPYEFGNDTWAEGSWKERSGANAWSGYTVDTKYGILFAATGTAASDFYGADRHGANLFGNCLIALDARTGKRLWHFQAIHHDLWDHDNPTPPTLATVQRGGKTIDVVALPTKTGFVYIFDRKTGKSLYPIVEKPAPPSDVPGEKAYPTQPMPTAPPPLSRQLITEADLTTRTPEAAAEIRQRVKAQKLRLGKWRQPPSLEGTLAMPGFHGGATWSGATFDPQLGYLFVNTNNNPCVVKLVPNGSGGYDFAGYTWFKDKDGYPGVKPPWGQLAAVDLSKGTIAWQIPLGYFPELADKTTGCENFGGAITTAGGLLFIASTRDEKIRAFESATGKLLWEGTLPAGGYACPATYQVNGKQYVVIAAGGGGKIGTRSGDSYIAFALP